VLLSGQSVSLLGSQAVQFAMIWWLTESTGSAAVLAAAGFLGLAPQIVLGPAIGALVDRWSRKRILWLADSLVAFASAGLALAFAAGPVPYPVVLAVLFVRALGDAFHAPAMLAMATVVNLFMVPAFALLPLLVMEQGGDAATLGWLNSTFGIGTIAGGVLLGVWGGFRRRVHTTFAGLMLAGVGTLVLGTATSASTALVGIVLLGVTIPCVNGPIQAVLQATVAPEFQGRVFTLYTSAAGAMTPLGLAIAAPVAELLGVHAWYPAGGVACVAMGVTGFLVPSITRIEDTEPVAAAADELPSEA
jgi:DHA3 family macrolide efflux protein-like MFS transporter